MIRRRKWKGEGWKEWKEEGGGNEIPKTSLSETSESMKCRFLTDFLLDGKIRKRMA